MSKDKTKETAIANPEGKTVEELKEVAQTLQTQLQDHQKQANHHQTMAVKAQGAMEVILQLIPKQEVEEMIAQEAKENNKDNGELVES
jgi:Ni,Fe-hydrogenase III component G